MAAARGDTPEQLVTLAALDFIDNIRRNNGYPSLILLLLSKWLLWP
jgi:hypothetical protein